MLIAVIIIITGFITFSCTFVYVKIIENIISAIIVIISEIPTPINMFFIVGSLTLLK